MCIRIFFRGIKSEHFNAICANGHCNSASEKVVKHKNECLARWIFQKWQPQLLEDLKFVKSWKLRENWNLNPFSENQFLKVYKHIIFRSEFAHKPLVYALIITFYFSLVYGLIIRGGELPASTSDEVPVPGIQRTWKKSWSICSEKATFEACYSSASQNNIKE